LGVVSADFSCDGKKDVMVVSGGSGSDQGGISVFLGNADGTVQPAVRYAAHSGPASAVAYDFNGDGKLDLAVANSVSGDVSILLGRGDGTFVAPVNYPAVAGASSIAVGDFNGDGRVDLAVGGGKNLAVLAGNGDGTFRAASVLPISVKASAPATGDFNKDGKLDLAVADLGGRVSILLGDGTGRFPTEYDYVAGYEPGGIFAMDLDGDGNLDVVVAAGHLDVLTPNPNTAHATGRDAGRRITVERGNLRLPISPAPGAPGVYRRVLGEQRGASPGRGGPLFLAPGNLVVPGPGGADIGPFAVSPAAPWIAGWG
jgi:hypothetical protein